MPYISPWTMKAKLYCIAISSNSENDKGVSYGLGDILHAFNALKQNYISTFICMISTMALWDFPELAVIVLTW